MQVGSPTVTQAVSRHSTERERCLVDSYLLLLLALVFLCFQASYRKAGGLDGVLAELLYSYLAVAKHGGEWSGRRMDRTSIMI